MTATATEEREAASSPARPVLKPEVVFSPDRELALLPKVFDPDWVWNLFRDRHEVTESPPERLRVREFSHSPGRAAQVSYEVHWPEEEFLPWEIFTVAVRPGDRIETTRYPEDGKLPGLSAAADPEGAVGLVNRHVLALPVRRARVELIRYRAGNRAVLGHRVGKARFYARVMRPDDLSAHLQAREFVLGSRFVAPRLAGLWEEGAVMWMAEMPGRNLRNQIRRRRGPDPLQLLDGLSSIWQLPAGAAHQSRFSFTRAYRRARRSLVDKSRDHAAAAQELERATGKLDPFIEAWQPSGVAHNDFYDDQLLHLPDGRIALVDFEETGPGDPLADVGNFLAHLRWTARVNRGRKADACVEYHDAFREAALDKFGWQERDLAVREAVCLFRVCTNAIRHPRADWQSQLQLGLAQVNEVLG